MRYGWLRLHGYVWLFTAHFPFTFVVTVPRVYVYDVTLLPGYVYLRLRLFTGFVGYGYTFGSTRSVAVGLLCVYVTTGYPVAFDFGCAFTHVPVTVGLRLRLFPLRLVTFTVTTGFCVLRVAVTLVHLRLRVAGYLWFGYATHTRSPTRIYGYIRAVTFTLRLVTTHTFPVTVLPVTLPDPTLPRTLVGWFPTRTRLVTFTFVWFTLPLPFIYTRWFTHTRSLRFTLPLHIAHAVAVTVVTLQLVLQFGYIHTLHTFGCTGLPLRLLHTRYFGCCSLPRCTFTHGWLLPRLNTHALRLLRLIAVTLPTLRLDLRLLRYRLR